MTSTADLHGIGSYIHSASLHDLVLDYLGEFAGDFDVVGLVEAYRGCINEVLRGVGIVMVGDQFFGDYPPPENYAEHIVAAIERADLSALAPAYELSEGVARRPIRIGLRVMIALVAIVVVGIAVGGAVAFASGG